MDRIRIYDKGQVEYFELPKTRDIQAGGEDIYEETTMISGKTVIDIVGYRRQFTAKWDYFPNALLTSVLTLIRQGGYFPVEITDDTGATEISMYKITQTSGTGVFKFVDGNPMWHDVSLMFVAQEVKTYA